MRLWGGEVVSVSVMGVEGTDRPVMVAATNLVVDFWGASGRQRIGVWGGRGGVEGP